MKRWVDARLELMRRQDRFMAILRNNVPARLVPAFSRNILRPNNRFGYPPPGSPSAGHRVPVAAGAQHHDRRDGRARRGRSSCLRP